MFLSQLSQLEKPTPKIKASFHSGQEPWRSTQLGEDFSGPTPTEELSPSVPGFNSPSHVHQDWELTYSSSWLDGTGRGLLVEGEGQEPFGLAFHGHHVYWTDWTSYSVWRVRLIYLCMSIVWYFFLSCTTSLFQNLGAKGWIAKTPGKTLELFKFEATQPYHHPIKGSQMHRPRAQSHLNHPHNYLHLQHPLIHPLLSFEHNWFGGWKTNR